MHNQPVYKIAWTMLSTARDMQPAQPPTEFERCKSPWVPGCSRQHQVSKCSAARWTAQQCHWAGFLSFSFQRQRPPQSPVPGRGNWQKMAGMSFAILFQLASFGPTSHHKLACTSSSVAAILTVPTESCAGGGCGESQM